MAQPDEPCAAQSVAADGSEDFDNQQPVTHVVVSSIAGTTTTPKRPAGEADGAPTGTPLAAPAPLPDAIRGIFADDRRGKPWTTSPSFATVEEAKEFAKIASWESSNPDFPQLTHIFTTLVTWEQVLQYLVPRREECLQQRRAARAGTPMPPPPPPPPVSPHVARLLEKVRANLSLPFHAALSPQAGMNMLKYLFFHMRCGIYVHIVGGKVAMFVPFVNKHYRNNWGHLLTLDERYEDVDQYYADKALYFRRSTNLIKSQQKWWANANIICNEYSTQIWGDSFLCELKDMLCETCAHHDVPDVEFFVNKRDQPQLRADLREPYDFVFPTPAPTLSRHKYEAYAPVCSFYVPDSFADLRIPCQVDWQVATGRVFPPLCMGAFTPEKLGGYTIPWALRKATAFFRGGATGGGTTVDTNQRLLLCQIGHEWQADGRYNGSDGSHPYIDVGITSWNFRDKKLPGRGMSFVHPDELDFSLADKSLSLESSIGSQASYKYILYVEGHCPGASSRYVCLMKTGSVILKVDAFCGESFDQWYMPLLQPFVDHVPVAADLSNLAERIEWCRTHDQECQAIAAAAQALWEKVLTKEGIMEYMSGLLRCIGDNTVETAVDAGHAVAADGKTEEDEGVSADDDGGGWEPVDDEMAAMRAAGLPVSFGNRPSKKKKRRH